ncbi:unnamed protein product [Ectocarpus sp. 6 AP-2014]
MTRTCVRGTGSCFHRVRGCCDGTLVYRGMFLWPVVLWGWKGGSKSEGCFQILLEFALTTEYKSHKGPNQHSQRMRPCPCQRDICCPVLPLGRPPSLPPNQRLERGSGPEMLPWGSPGLRRCPGAPGGIPLARCATGLEGGGQSEGSCQILLEFALLTEYIKRQATLSLTECGSGSVSARSSLLTPAPSSEESTDAGSGVVTEGGVGVGAGAVVGSSVDDVVRGRLALDLVPRLVAGDPLLAFWVVHVETK